MSQPVVSAIEHYQDLLAEHYTWMSGDFASKVAQQAALLGRLGISPGQTGEAVDLGCGPGFQSLALAGLGFSVTAVDANAQLLAELRRHAEGRSIRTVEYDLAALEGCPELPAEADWALCMGDTLSHLPDPGAVIGLFDRVHRMLTASGSLVLGFRDLSQELHGPDRFIPVRADGERIMTCFLEYEKETVLVTDLIYVLKGEEGWKLRKSSYRKLRLDPGWVRSRLAVRGFQMRHEEQTAGMFVMVAQKPG